MKIQVYFQPNQVEESLLKGKTVLVIDILRASTTIASALFHGAKEIIPSHTLDNATKIASNLFAGQSVLGGERHGKKIDGFDLGNSPLEYHEENVNKKSIVFATTNGTVAIYRARYGDKVIITGFVNITSVVNYIKEQNLQELYILCAGKDQAFCIEDALCAGAIIDRLFSSHQFEFQLSDSARASLMMWERMEQQLVEVLKESDHGKYLISIGAEADIDICATLDIYPVIPILKDSSTIKLHTENQPIFKRVEI